MQNDRDLMAEWAGTEFVAAGRAKGADKRRRHRRQAEFFAEILYGLKDSPERRPGRTTPTGEALRRAFGSNDRSPE